MTLIRLCAAQKEVARDGGRKGMKDWSGGEYSCSFFEADTMSLHPFSHRYRSLWYKMHKSSDVLLSSIKIWWHCKKNCRHNELVLKSKEHKKMFPFCFSLPPPSPWIRSSSSFVLIVKQLKYIKIFVLTLNTLSVCCHFTQTRFLIIIKATCWWGAKELDSTGVCTLKYSSAYNRMPLFLKSCCILNESFDAHNGSLPHTSAHPSLFMWALIQLQW